MQKREKACGRKTAYPDKDAAIVAVNRMIRRTGTARTSVQAYACGKGTGKHWHFGHRSGTGAKRVQR